MFSVVTLKLILWWVQRHAMAILAVIGITAAVISPDLIRIYRLSIPIESRAELTGTIVSVLTSPTSTRAVIGRGSRLDYNVRLPDGRVVFVSGPRNRPRATGESVILTRSTRVGGRVTYEFADNPLPYRPGGVQSRNVVHLQINVRAYRGGGRGPLPCVAIPVD